jgi:hypothetical protein
MSPDGNTVLIGGYRDNGGVGAAWVFTRASEKWTQQGAKLTAKEESGAGEFGKSVALSAESESKMYAVIGGPGDNANVGAAWVLTRTSGVWSQQGAKLTAKAGEEIGAGEFGSSVSVAATKGEYALIGAPGDKEHIGGAFVFFRTGTAWAQQGAKLVAKSGEETGDGEFGKSVAVSPEGVYALMGAPSDKPSETGSTGAAWTFMRASTTWTQQGAKLLREAAPEKRRRDGQWFLRIQRRPVGRSRKQNLRADRRPQRQRQRRRGVDLPAHNHHLGPDGHEAHRNRGDRHR